MESYGWREYTLFLLKVGYRKFWKSVNLKCFEYHLLTETIKDFLIVAWIVWQQQLEC